MSTVPTVLVVLILVPYEGRYLIVEECDGTYYMPAGKVEPGENLLRAAMRETMEEAGVAVGLRGLLGFDHSWSAGTMKLRFAFVGFVAGTTKTKDRPDHHSRRALWLDKSDLRSLPLRDPELVDWIARYESGTPLLPCDAYRTF
jgi:phosphatase NudJ